MVFQAAVFPISECSEENLLMTIPLLRSPEWNDGDEMGAAENGEGDGIQARQMQHLTNEMANGKKNIYINSRTEPAFGDDR